MNSIAATMDPEEGPVGTSSLDPSLVTTLLEERFAAGISIQEEDDTEEDLTSMKKSASFETA